MEFKGTKGQWRLSSLEATKGKYVACELNIDFSENLHNCVTVYCDNEIPTENELANAKLIASAPELLEALMKIRKSIKDQKLESKFGHTLSYVDEAINKALK